VKIKTMKSKLMLNGLLNGEVLTITNIRRLTDE